MVLESIIDPFAAKKHPMWLFFMGILFAFISFFFSLWIFKDQAGMVMVFLTVMLSVPLMYATLEQEEEEDWNTYNEKKLLKEHSRSIVFLSSLFLGFVVGFTLLYVFLPASIVDTTFAVQTGTINAINSQPTLQSGYAYTGGAMAMAKILVNNFKVMIFSIFFALFFGAGAIFILAWNASVISAAIGSYIRNGLASSANAVGFSGLSTYMTLFLSGVGRFMIHGIFEIIGYFIAALAGGIISIGIVRHGVNSEKFRNILYDVIILVLIASVFLIIGAIIEVYVTPALF